MSDGTLQRLLVRRLQEEGMRPDTAFSVAELHRKLLPYGLTRSELGYATKAEYDVALLGLLKDESRTEIEERALREAVTDELGTAEPGLAFLQKFAASEIRLRVGGRPEAPDAEPEPREATAFPAAPPGEVTLASGDGQPAPPPVGGATCRSCGTSLPERDGLRFCPHCGASQLDWPCAGCTEPVQRGWRYCPMCGTLQPVA